MKPKNKKIRNYIIYTGIMAIILGSIAPPISRYVENNYYFDWQWFAWVWVMAVLVLILYLYFPKFKKAGEI